MSEFKVTKGPWKVKHSQSKPAFNIIGTSLGGKYKIARCPYFQDTALSEELNNREIDEAKANATLMSCATDLLEALQGITNALHNLDKSELPITVQKRLLEFEKKSHQAINKALGNV